MGRTKMYGEDTVLFSRRVPESKLSEIEKIVDNLLAPLLIKRKMKRKLDPVADPVLYVSAEGAKAIEKVFKDIVMVGHAEFHPEQIKNVDTPPVKEIAPPLIRDSKTGAITFPCGCFDDGEFHIPNGCQLGDKSDHVVYYWDEK